MTKRPKQRPDREHFHEAFPVRWQRPLRMEVDTDIFSLPTQPGYEGRGAINIHVDDEGLDRIRRLEACHQCGQTFPAPPNKRNTHLFEGVAWPLDWARTIEVIHDERCPMCLAKITPEAVALAEAEGAQWDRWMVREDGSRVYQDSSSLIWTP